MAAFNPPKELNGFPLSERTQWLLFAPTWMLFPNWRRQVLSKPIDYISPGFGGLRSELRSSTTFRWPSRNSASMPKNELGEPKRQFSETFSAFTAIREH